MGRHALIFVGFFLCLVQAGCGPKDRCFSHDHTICVQGRVHWVDACNTLEEELENCDCGCNQDYTGCQKPCDCQPRCEGKQCGSNQCGGTCPPGCTGDQECNPITGQCETTCQPDCLGKCCGDDGCGGECPDRCDLTGQACDPESCRCQGTCEPDCQDRECGPDGCGATCPPGCLDAETCSADGWCEAHECGSRPPTVTGALDTGVAPVAYDEARVSLVHKRDIDEYEDGCIVSIDIDLWHGTGCQLKLSAGGRYSQQGGLLVQTVEFSADSFCRNFPDHTEGTYTAGGDMPVAEIQPAVREVPGSNMEEACFPSDFVIRLEGTLQRIGDGEELTVGPAEITVSGDAYSTGHTEYPCPCVPDCQGRECGDDGCNTPCGTCAGQPVYCSQEGMCIDDCQGLECGDSPVHGYHCGSCPDLESCLAGECLCDYAPCGELCCAADEICHHQECCRPDCQGKVCGSDGCGGSCGSCTGSTEYCDAAGQCIDDCAGRECGTGPDQGFDCGSCPGDFVHCSSAGQCTCNQAACGDQCCAPGQSCHLGSCCTPDCNGAECGPDGCGGSCGDCPFYAPVCAQGECVECLNASDCPDPDAFICENHSCQLDCDEDGYEPNSAQSQAAEIPEPFDQALTLCGQHDADWFEVHLAAGETYFFNIYFTHQNGDVDISVRTPDDASVASGASITDNEYIDYSVPDGAGGTYYIKVYLYSGYAQNYRLDFRETE